MALTGSSVSMIFSQIMRPPLSKTCHMAAITPLQGYAPTSRIFERNHMETFFKVSTLDEGGWLIAIKDLGQTLIHRSDGAAMHGGAPPSCHGLRPRKALAASGLGPSLMPSIAHAISQHPPT